jgi:hypothetical protein
MNKQCEVCGVQDSKDCPLLKQSAHSQSRLASMVEAVVNTGVGMVLAMWATALICWAYSIPMSWTNNFIITFWMTVISIVRSYVIRRAWNAEFWKRWARR